MNEATSSPGATVRKRIALDVVASKPDLRGLETSITKLHALESSLASVNHWANQVGNAMSRMNFGNLGQSASVAAVQIGQVTTAARKAGAAARDAINAGSQPPSRIGGRGGDRTDRRASQHYSGAQALTPAGIAHNTATAAGWMIGISGMMRAVETVEYSVRRMSELERQTAILRQTFRGAGGSALQLADDVLKVAAAEARGSDEAMKAAIHWTRLGLSRRQAAEATRVSLIAANVAEMTAADATEKISSVMATYGLRASELESTLGMLSRTSQTYRVTVGELLNGLSRVSNVAKASGMSLAELQGIMGALVQRTGLSGERVANALQIFLSRINNPGVQEFFELRYGLKLTGNESDLGAISKIYKRVGDEERKQIRLVTGTARQSNIFSALMDIYPEKFTAAISSLQHLSAALDENVKVTNTASAAAQRLQTSWDRLINSPRVSNEIADRLNSVSALTQGVSNFVGTKANTSPLRYYNPGKSTIMGGLLGMVRDNDPYFGTAMKGANLASGGAVDRYISRKQGFSSEPETDEDKFKADMRPIITHNTLAEIHGEKRRLAEYMGDTAQAKKEKQLQQEEAKIARDLIESKAKALDIAYRAEKSDEKRLSIARDLAEVLGQQVTNLRNEDIEVEDMEGRFEHLKQTLEHQRLLAEDMANTVKGIGAPKWVEDVIGTEGQLRATKGMRDNLDMSNPWAARDFEELSRKIRELEAMAKYQTGITGSSFTMQKTFSNVAQRMASINVESQGVGLSEGERALDRRHWIEKELHGLAGLRVKTQNDLNREIVLTGSLLNTELSVQERIKKLEQERRQTMIEAQREFQRSLVTASPGDILRKLALSQITHGGKTGAGQFFAMSSEMRGDAYTLMGGEQMARLSWERRALRGQGVSTQTMQGLTWAGEKRIADLANGLSISAEAAAKVANHMNTAARSAEMIERAIVSAARAAAVTWEPAKVAPNAMRSPQAGGY